MTRQPNRRYLLPSCSKARRARSAFGVSPSRAAAPSLPAIRPAQRAPPAPHPNATLHLADAMTLDLRALDPAPAKVVANLPYGIAAGAILRTIEELDAVQRWVGMVQKEVGERFAAAPGTSAYGLPSVLAQLACEVQVLRSV